LIEILSSGAFNTVQDGGRQGWLSRGVSRSGAMDRPALEAANALIGNDLGAAAIEVASFPFRLRFHADMAVAVSGAAGGFELAGRRLPPWWAATARGGEVLVIPPPSRGARVYVAVGGGVDVPLLMGARATELKSGFGGYEGRGLLRGDRLAVLPASMGRLPEDGFGLVPPAERSETDAPIRLLPAAEWADFSTEAQVLLADAGWTVTSGIDRQGCRLDGPELVRERRRELLSHGIVPGTVQVPPAGRPIIQLAEANTCGGYPKIATVIEADLWRFGQVVPGDRLRFRVVDRTEAVAALKAQRADIERMRAAAALYRV
jgi:biotin-dependent carboxylase-like uncharacterized protein